MDRIILVVFEKWQKFCESYILWLPTFDFTVFAFIGLLILKFSKSNVRFVDTDLLVKSGSEVIDIQEIHK